MLKRACAKIALTFLKMIIIVKMLLNRKNGMNQRTIVERLRNVNFFMSSTVFIISTCIMAADHSIHVHVYVYMVKIQYPKR